MKRSSSILVVIVGVVMMVGCAVKPSVRAWRPWLRSSQTVALSAPGTVAVRVDIEKTILIEGKNAEPAMVQPMLEKVLARRGYTVVSDNAELVLTIRYSTERHDTWSTSSSSYSNVANTSVGVSGWGQQGYWWPSYFVLNAFAASLKSTTSTQVSMKSTMMFTHVMHFEMKDAGGTVMWNADAMWESAQPSLVEYLPYVSGLMLAELPQNTKKIPEIEEVDAKKADNYFRLYLNGQQFNCPAIPYYCYFKSAGMQSDKMPSLVKNPELAHAYRDLLIHAETVLPIGKKSLKDPFSIGLWSVVQVGGKYHVGTDKKLRYVMITLVASNEAYLINSCKEISADEYEGYQKRVAAFKDALGGYRDVFVK